MESEHRLITRGAYGLVRHPIYLGVLLIWAGLAAANLSVLAGVIAAGYVLPAYLLHSRAEEKMLLAEFGSDYHDYCKRVGRLVPRFGFLGRGDGGREG